MSEYKYTSLLAMKDYMILYHSIQKKHKIHPVQYCILNMVSKLTTNVEYAQITKGDIARFIKVSPSQYWYHFSILERKFVEHKPGIGTRIKDEFKDDFEAYTIFRAPYTIVSYNLISKWNVTLTQYCILHSIFITQYYSRHRLSRTSYTKIAANLCITLQGLKKSLTILETKKYICWYEPHGIFLDDRVLDGFYDIHSSHEDISATVVIDSL